MADKALALVVAEAAATLADSEAVPPLSAGANDNVFTVGAERAAAWRT